MITVLAVIGQLLDYPTESLCNQREAISKEIRQTPYLPPELRRNLVSRIQHELAQDIYALQARYDGLFDRGRALSLLLFEHVHGESRERGSAMVALLNCYLEAGMEPVSNQLPDYLPLFLEFLATQEETVAANWLADVSHILLLLAERLRKRNAWEAELFDALLLISGAPISDDRVRAQVAAEADDSALEALDRAWEDKEIRFDEATLEPQSSASCGGFSQIERRPPQHAEDSPYGLTHQFKKTEQPVVWHQTRRKNPAKLEQSR